MNFKKMGVVNVTPDSFSDGGELSPSTFFDRLKSMGPLDALDIGAESTAPMNRPITWQEEWERLKPYLPLLKKVDTVLSFDTYHPETIEEIIRVYESEGFTQELWWNDVSGKFDGFVRDFLELSPKFRYVLCHSLVPNRAQTTRHMDYVDPELTLENLADYFRPFRIPQIVFDPCLGFSKTFEQNWMILDEFYRLQKLVDHEHWLLGFSRKSFLRRKFDIPLSERERLDQVHQEVLGRLQGDGCVWIRTHRPEFLRSP